MDKKKIETFGLFCELIANEPENIYCGDDEESSKDELIDRNIPFLLGVFTGHNFSSYYHIPAKKEPYIRCITCGDMHRQDEFITKDNDSIFHCPKKKKKTMAQYCSTTNHRVYVFDIEEDEALDYIKIPNSEFEIG